MKWWCFGRVGGGGSGTPHRSGPELFLCALDVMKKMLNERL